jgi:hypothetical protein
MTEVIDITEQWDAARRRGGPPTLDDCSITGDGTRLDTADKVIAFFVNEALERGLDIPEQFRGYARTP